MGKILFLFVDGIGLGDESDDNPFHVGHLPGFERLSGGRPWTRSAPESVYDTSIFKGIDALLGVDGLPQSGTGQATLFTGVNCAELAERHYGPFPHSRTFEAIRAHNVFGAVERKGGQSAFANAYPPIFFDLARKRNRWSVTTRACLDAGIHVRTIDDLKGGRAVAADVTGAGLVERLGLDVTIIDEREAASRLLSLAEIHDFTAFEYYLTDRAGHKQSLEQAKACLEQVDRLLQALLDDSRMKEITLVLTSDHGNVEDLSVRTHTLNPVPLAVRGQGSEAFHGAMSLMDVAPAILETATVR